VTPPMRATWSNQGFTINKQTAEEVKSFGYIRQENSWYVTTRSIQGFRILLDKYK